MIALDTTFLVDYLDGVDATADFLARHDDMPFVAPSLVLFEVHRGAARADGAAGIDRVDEALEWVDPLALTAAGAREAARVEAAVLDAGEPVNLGDVLIAGVCRHNDATLVTRDEDFGRVPDLDVEFY